ncbi:MAG: hypothetical protein WAU59_12925 [Rhodoplanes sp.]
MLFYVQMRWNYQGRISQDQLWDLEALEGVHGVEGIRAGFVQLYKVVSQKAYCVVPGSSIFSAGDMISGLILAAVFRAADASRRIPVAVFLLRGALRGVTFPFRGLARPMMSQ